ncbi:efflux RND transporter permease subunit [Crenobacter intestini]|uniref:Efflux pump membrane transporter n=1 Tax=Crenobacter intestini TaxID=2563443 RepID=A0A4T0UZL9_9NEIS|nr:efflux RND transporter permease subunit [Crenobacter intestini]TIC84672.1 multidrug efflux RND transporter permease subunit [Crenobacter intestini]
MFSAFFIRRPIFATVISLVIMLAGLAAIRALPVEQYPDIVPPQVQVQANYPGASAQVIADTVASPLEQSINGVEDMIYMQSSSSSNGQLTLNVSFKIGTDPDQATINVNNRVQSALTQLPQEVRRQGVTVTKQSTAMLQIISLYSPDRRFDTLYTSNYATLNIVDELKRIPGVGNVVNFASQDYSMRVWLKPDQLAKLKLTPSDVSAAINQQNAQYAAGKVGAEPMPKATEFTYTVTTQGRLTDVKEFENIIIRSNPDGSNLRLKDVARVELGALNYDFMGTYNGVPTVPIGIYLSPGANQLAVADQVKATMAKLGESFPTGLSYSIPYDTTDFVKVSIDEVYKTFLEAMVLVFAVVYLFLQNWRATLIPCLAVPVSIIGTFAGMYALGFSINTLTLFGMVLAIGIVVDDAIVVLENVERIMSEEKLPPREASIKAMEEVAGPVVAIVLVLVSVFLPVAFLGGIAGQMYKQFAITIAVSVTISGIVALTLTPALCALLLKEGHQKPAGFFVKFNEFFDKVTHRYTEGVRFLLKRVLLAFVVFGAMLAITAGLFRMVPGSLAPEEDQGYVIGAAILPDGASLSRTAEAMDKFGAELQKNPAVSVVMNFAGFDILSGGNKTNAGVSFVTLKPWSERKGEDQSAFAVVKDIFRIGGGISEGVVLGFNPPPISGMSSTGGFEAFIQNRSGASPEEIGVQVKKLVAAASKRPELAGISTTFSADVPQINVKLDREKTVAYGVQINQVFDTMQSTFGSLYVNDFNKFGRIYKVQLQSEADFRSKIDDLRNVFVRSASGNMIPITSLVTVEMTTGPQTLERFNAFPAAKVVGGPAPGYSSGESLKAMQDVAKEVLPSDYTLAWSGSAYQEQSTSGSSFMVFGFGMIMVFLILAAQYERWTLPLAVLTAVPFALFGAIMATWLRGLQNDIYFQVALVALIGLAAKNAILIVEFAVMKYEEGMNLFDASLEAAKLRFRPIVMTSLAFILGVVPLAISTGAGSASRHAIGTGVIGGMLAATFIAVFFIPLFFMLIMKVSNRGKPAAPAAEAEDKEAGHA